MNVSIVIVGDKIRSGERNDLAAPGLNDKIEIWRLNWPSIGPLHRNRKKPCYPAEL